MQYNILKIQYEIQYYILQNTISNTILYITILYIPNKKFCLGFNPNRTLNRIILSLTTVYSSFNNRKFDVKIFKSE